MSMNFLYGQIQIAREGMGLLNCGPRTRKTWLVNSPPEHAENQSAKPLTTSALAG